jgi:polysaccharide biosynthesis protein PslH
VRTLFLSPRECWPAQSGAKLREYHMARALGERSQMTYLHFAEPGGAGLTRADLPFCEQVISIPKPPTYTKAQLLQGLIGRWPLPVVNYTAEPMLETLRELLRKQRYDLLHLDSVHMALYVERLGGLGFAVPPVVYNWHNVESEAMRRYSEAVDSPARRWYASWTVRKWQALERQVLRDSFGHIVCSQREREQLRAIAPTARLAVIPNGVDTAYFGATAGAAPGTARTRVVFVGTFDYFPNIEAAVEFTRNVWPQLRERLPGSRLTLVGARPDEKVLALGREPRVEVTGTVPDVRPYYHEAAVAIVPLRTGAGTRLKILEAMAAGVPVISTPLGAEGLEVRSGDNIVLADADDREAWLRGIVDLCQEPARSRIAGQALQLVRERYDWQILGKSLWATYQSWLDARASS